MIDRKFKILAVNPCNGKIYTEKEGVFFCAKDVALLQGGLPGYLAKCKEIGCGEEHIESVELMIDRVKTYQEENPDKVKIPDTDLPCEIDRCIGGNV